jgi:hypothetical protein
MKRLTSEQESVILSTVIEPWLLQGIPEPRTDIISLLEIGEMGMVSLVFKGEDGSLTLQPTRRGIEYVRTNILPRN